MKKTFLKCTITAVAAFLLFSVAPSSAFADHIVDITVNTSGLGTGSSEVLFFLTGTGTNRATLSGFSLGGGTAGAVDLGNVSGSGTGASNGLNTGVSLDDGAAFLNGFAQYFTAGTELAFVLDLTTNAVLPNPDQFSFAILDPTGNPVATSDPTGFDNLLTINIDSASPAPNVYSNLITVTTPVVTPEPSSILLLAGGFVGLATSKWRISSRQRRA